jgi:hypothetical protein
MFFESRSVKHLALTLGAMLFMSGFVPAAIAQVKTPIRGMKTFGDVRCAFALYFFITGCLFPNFKAMLVSISASN